MAETGTLAPSQPSSPLGSLTNEAHKRPDEASKTLRRTRSSRALYGELDSSESVPSFHYSIWDADVARSDGHRTENHASSPEISPTSPRLPRADCLSSLSLEHIDRLSDLPARAQSCSPTNYPLSHTRPNTVFNPTLLEPIIEQRSVASLRSHLSRTRLGRSPIRQVNVVHTQHSYHSIHPSQRQKSRRPLEKPLALPSPAPSPRRRAFSLNDLDCFNLSSLDCPTPKPRSSISSSSTTEGGWYREKSSRPAEPHQPPNAPPDRIPTPPGIPTFGSPDAINYFNRSRPRARSPSWWRIGGTDRSTAHPPPAFPPSSSSTPNASAAAAALAATLHPTPPARPQAQPERMGISRSFSLLANAVPQRSSRQPRRASLPPGVVLLRADDGTLIRGRFGARASGHGISSRGLEGHPMQRAVNLSRESKDVGVIVGRQRARPLRQEEEQGTMMSAAAVGTEERAPHGRRSVRMASAVRGLLLGGGWDHRSTALPRPARGDDDDDDDDAETQQPRPDRVESGTAAGTAAAAAAAGVDGVLGRDHPPGTTATAPSSPNNNNPQTNIGPPAARPLTDDTHASDESSFYYYYLRYFCICCCGMTERELDGCGWYGADRPWLRQRGGDGDGVREGREAAGVVRRRDNMRFRAGG